MCQIPPTTPNVAVMTQEPAENHAQIPGLANGSAPINPLSLTVDEAARMLTAAGGKKVTPEMVQADIDAGAPTTGGGGGGAGGRINLVHYAAWLIREVQASGT